MSFIYIELSVRKCDAYSRIVLKSKSLRLTTYKKQVMHPKFVVIDSFGEMDWQAGKKCGKSNQGNLGVTLV